MLPASLQVDSDLSVMCGSKWQDSHAHEKSGGQRFRTRARRSVRRPADLRRHGEAVVAREELEEHVAEHGKRAQGQALADGNHLARWAGAGMQRGCCRYYARAFHIVQAHSGALRVSWMAVGKTSRQECSPRATRSSEKPSSEDHLDGRMRSRGERKCAPRPPTALSRSRFSSRPHRSIPICPVSPNPLKAQHLRVKDVVFCAGLDAKIEVSAALGASRPGWIYVLEADKLVKTVFKVCPDGPLLTSPLENISLTTLWTAPTL